MSELHTGKFSFNYLAAGMLSGWQPCKRHPARTICPFSFGGLECSSGARIVPSSSQALVPRVSSTAASPTRR